MSDCSLASISGAFKNVKIIKADGVTIKKVSGVDWLK